MVLRWRLWLWILCGGKLKHMGWRRGFARRSWFVCPGCSRRWNSVIDAGQYWPDPKAKWVCGPCKIVITCFKSAAAYDWLGGERGPSPLVAIIPLLQIKTRVQL